MAKLGLHVFFLTRLGDDIYSHKLMDNFRCATVDLKYIKQLLKTSTGIASITIDSMGQNSIVIVPGANDKLEIDDVEKAEGAIKESSVAISQLEIPLDVVYKAAVFAEKYNVPFILDPAPGVKLEDDLLRKVSIIKPNETEAEILTGIKVCDEYSVFRAGCKLLSMGVKVAIITLGARGSLIVSNDNHVFVPARKVDVVDSTAAGDCFTGAFAYAIAMKFTLTDSVRFANYAASIGVTRLGAQCSMPTLTEVQNVLEW